MKKIFGFSMLAAAVLVLAGLTSCNRNALDTDQYSGTVALAAIAPNPVMRGGELRLIGANLETVSEVRFSGGVSVSSIQTITAGPRSEIRVTVPLEGPEVGPVTIVTSNGATASTRFDLEYTEPIEVASIAPEEALSGDTITITGEYLNDVREVIFGGEVIVTGFESQSRHELKVIVPANAVTGSLIVGDVNEIEDESTIPNRIYAPVELTIGQPTVETADPATYKSGDQVTVTGEHLDMIQYIHLPQANDIDFEVSADATSITFHLPPTATDGNITLVSYAGDEFDAGEIKTVTVADLAIAPLAADGRYKASTDVKIEGSDLDLVSKVDFVNAEASWYLQDGAIIATVPAAAQDGSVTLTLDSGKQAWTDAIEVVKPVVTGTDKTEGVAGETVITVSGTDLDLVDNVKIGTKAQGFFDCDFEIKADDAGVYYVEVLLPAKAYSSPVTLTAESGYASETGEISVSYNEAVSIEFDAPSFALGKNISFTGKNLLQIESVSIKGKKVVGFVQRADNAMAFAIPDGIGPGVYRLDLVLVDGSTLTWSVPFSITASYTETFLWEGSHDLAGWGANFDFGTENTWAEAGLKAGDQIRVYYETYNDWWQFQLHDTHWGDINLDILDGGCTVSAANAPGGSTYFTIDVTDDLLATLTSSQGWGAACYINGEGAKITGVSMIQFGSAETVIYEGPTTMTWGDDGRFGLALKYFEDAGADSKLIVYFKQTENWGQVQFNDGWWSNDGVVFPELGGAYLTTDNAGGKDVTKIELTITAELLDLLKSRPGDYFGLNTAFQADGRVGMVIQGSDWIIEKIAIQ